ncbi:hypothetical protein EBB07_28635 [Paenibacillaceae bacterium]|nr:hypothetical protein EBB07_28635 [Paenibacillaceae bacterium]
MFRSNDDQTLKFRLVNAYAPDDRDFLEDEYDVSLYDLDDNKLIMSGDYYHNKIHVRINGFFKALDYYDIAYDVETVRVNSDHY